MNFNILDSVSMASKQGVFNQDYISNFNSEIFNNGALILDGASPLTPETGYETHQFVKDFSDTFIRIEASGINSLHAVIENTLRALIKDVNLDDPMLSPSASAVIMRFDDRGNRLELIQVGDCKAYLYEDTKSQLPSPVFAKSKIEYLDDIALNAQSAYIQLGFSADDARKLIDPILQNHRKLMNSPQGYASLTLASSCKNLLNYQSFQLEADKNYKILMATDGFYKGLEDYNQTTLLDIMNRNIPLETALIEYRDIEARDDSLTIFPRFKIHDDASAILISIQPA